MPPFSIRTLVTAVLGVASSTAALFFWPPPASDDNKSTGSIVGSRFDDAGYRAKQWVNAGLFEDDRSGIKPLPSAKSGKRSTTTSPPHASPVLLTTATWQHQLAENDNWAILVSCSFVTEHERHLQWLTDVAKTYHDAAAAGLKSDAEPVQMAYVDAKESPELVALLQVRAYPSIRILSLADTASSSSDAKADTSEAMVDREQRRFHLRNFSRGLTLSARFFAHHVLATATWQHVPVYTELSLRISKDSALSLGSRDRAWSPVYVLQVRAFNCIYEAVDSAHTALVNWLVKHRRTFYPTIGAAVAVGFIGAHLASAA